MKYPSPKIKNGKLDAPVSLYQPSKEVQEITAQVIKDYEQGHRNWNTPLNEYNGRSVIQEINANQKSFNSYVPEKSDDPDESWRAQTIRPIVRNKLISIAAHVLASIIYPNVFAQNNEQKEDKDAAEIMQDIIQWIIEDSNYSKAFVLSVIASLVDPACVINQEYAEVYRKIKKIKSDGTWEWKEELDEILSGFQTHTIPLSEFYLANLYEPNLQKQRFVIRQRYIDYADAKILHGKYENFKYVKPGKCAWFNAESSTFYDTSDEDKEKANLVHEVTYYSRPYDLQLTFINGVIMCEADKPLQREDKRYPFALSGYEPINNGSFALFKSAANKLGPDEDLVNTLYNMVLDGSFLALMPPVAVYGGETLNSSVIVPGAITNLRSETKLETIGPKSDLRAGLLAIEEVEKSISESSQDNMRAGLVQGGERTAYEVQRLEENAQRVLGLFGRFIGFLVSDVGNLMVGDILQHLTVPEIKEISNVSDPLKYKSLLIPSKVKDGKKITKKIEFTDKYADSNKDEITKGLEILKEEGGLDSDQRIYKINPAIFRDAKYKIIISPDKFEGRSKALERALNLELYDRAIANPFANQQMVTQDFLFESYKPGESSKYMRQEQKQVPPPGSPEGTFESPQGTNMNMVGQMTGSNSLKNALSAGAQ